MNKCIVNVAKIGSIPALVSTTRSFLINHKLLFQDAFGPFASPSEGKLAAITAFQDLAAKTMVNNDQLHLVKRQSVFRLRRTSYQSALSF